VALPHNGAWPLVDLLTTLGLATSKSDAKRLIEQGSVSIDGAKVADPRATVAVRPGMVLRGRRRQYVRIALPEEEA
jgi:tyrosyl-tRNA synthetase